MKLLKNSWMILVIILAGSCHTETCEVLSPDGNLKVTVLAAEDNTYGDAAFAVEYKGKNILPPSKLGLETNLQSFTGNVRLISASASEPVTDDYRMITGKRSHCVNRASEKVYWLENEQARRLKVTFRVYNDGVAFKYGLEATSEGEHITAEHTTYAVPQGAKRWIQQYDATGYERFYPLSTDGKLTGNPSSDQWGYPALVEPADSVFLLITEANIRRGHCGSFLCNGTDRNRYQVRLADEELPVQGSWQSPWRVLMAGTLADVVESTLVTDVSDPAVTEDTDWIVPGTAAWIYWAHNHGTRDFQKVKEYIDLAAHMKWTYDLMDCDWDVMGNGGNIEDAVKYALQKGVKPLIWYNSSTNWTGTGAPGPLYRLNEKENREKEYKWLSDLGIAGVKIDFFRNDRAETMNYYIDLLEDAVKYKLLINFHGATIPRGWQRTYPHLMSVEGVYGAEWYNNTPLLTNRAAEHNATLPFTRNVIGPMDYTPGTFTDSQHPHITSHGHELALTVLFESALQHMPDRPSAYYALPQPVKDMLSELPAAWDDTRLLAGYPGIDVVMARRKGDVWYIAGINGTNEARMLRFAPQELPGVGKSMTTIKDGADDRSFGITENMPLPYSGGYIEIECLPRGGFVAVIK